MTAKIISYKDLVKRNKRAKEERSKRAGANSKHKETSTWM